MNLINEITKDSVARFSHMRKGIMYYNVETDDVLYVFPIDIRSLDISKDELPRETKVWNIMKYLVKAIEKGAFLRVSKG